MKKKGQHSNVDPFFIFGIHSDGYLRVFLNWKEFSIIIHYKNTVIWSLAS